MSFKSWTTQFALVVVMAVMGFAVAGCGESAAEGDAVADTSNATLAQAVDDQGWWCVEHGVPEAECALCDSSLVAKFKADGDWCEEHNRPESQCFLCNPARFDKFAARYEAKFGMKPPKPEGM